MILNTRQANRFRKLFDPLMDYLSHLPSMREAHRRMSGSDETPLEEVVFRAIWGTEGDPSPIDDYVALNPNRLNRTDLREVESWKSGICDEFPVVRARGDVLFLYGDHAFAVRGIYGEIDANAPVPGYILTVILPFDGLITYGLAMKVATDDLDPATYEAFAEVEQQYGQQGTTVRTARQFLQAAPVARELERQAALEDGGSSHASSAPAGGTARAGEDEARAGSMPTADGAGPAVLAESEVGLLRDQAFALYDQLCETGTPIETLEDAYRGMPRDEIVAMAQAMGLKVPRARMRNKTALVKTLASATDACAQYVLAKAQKQGAFPMRQLRRLVEHGGRLEVAPGDFHSFEDVFIPEPPFLRLYRTGETYVMVMPRELAAALAKTAWDDAIRRAEAIDDQLDTIATMVDFRGVVSLDEALTALIKKMGYQISDELDLLIEALAEHLNRGALPFQVLTLRWPHGEYCVSEDLVGDRYLELMAPAPDPDRILAILDARRTIPPRDTAGAQAPASVLELVRTRPSYRKLCRFLDAHVPQGHDRATYAGDVADAIVLGARSSTDSREVRTLIDEYGSALAKAHVKHYQELAQDLARDTPRWVMNGWAPNEL